MPVCFPGGGAYILPPRCLLYCSSPVHPAQFSFHLSRRQTAEATYFNLFKVTVLSVNICIYQKNNLLQQNSSVQQNSHFLNIATHCCEFTQVLHENSSAADLGGQMGGWESYLDYERVWTRQEFLILSTRKARILSPKMHHTLCWGPADYYYVCHKVKQMGWSPARTLSLTCSTSSNP